MTEGIGCEGAKKGTGLIAGDDVGLEQVDLGRTELGEFKLVREAGEGDGAADEGTVIAYHARREGNACG